MTFRIAKIDDIPSLNDLVNGAYRGEGSKQGWTTEADLLDGIRTSEHSLQEMIERPGAVIILAEDDNALKAAFTWRNKAMHFTSACLRFVQTCKGKD